MLGLLLGAVLSSVAPLEVDRPPRVDIGRAIQEGRSIRGGWCRTARLCRTRAAVQLRGCVNDVFTMLSTLQRITFPIQECCVLVDDPQFPNFTDYPTRANMIRYMGWLVADARPGDVLFVHYSGHGGQTRAVNDSQEKYDQTLCPVDYARAGTILDDDLFLLLCQPLPPGVRLTCVFDCCHSASMLDLPFSFVASHQLQQRTGYQMRQVRNDNFANADILLFSGCTDDGTSADIQGGPNGAGGAATNAFTWCLLNTSGLSFMDILLKTRNNLKSQGYKQVPQLTSSKPVDLSKTFSLFGPLSVNQQQMQHHVPPPFQHHPPPQMMHFNLPPPPGPGYHPQGPYGGNYQPSSQGYFGGPNGGPPLPPSATGAPVGNYPRPDLNSATGPPVGNYPRQGATWQPPQQGPPPPHHHHHHHHHPGGWGPGGPPPAMQGGGMHGPPPPHGYPPHGYPPHGYPPQGYPPQGPPPPGWRGGPVGHPPPGQFRHSEREREGRWKEDGEEIPSKKQLLLSLPLFFLVAFHFPSSFFRFSLYGERRKHIFLSAVHVLPLPFFLLYNNNKKQTNNTKQATLRTSQPTHNETSREQALIPAQQGERRKRLEVAAANTDTMGRDGTRSTRYKKSSQDISPHPTQTFYEPSTALHSLFLSSYCEGSSARANPPPKKVHTAHMLGLIEALTSVAPVRVSRPDRVDVSRAIEEGRSIRGVVPYRAPVPYTGGRVKALFIGINYIGTQSQLSGCINDVHTMLSTLQRITFPIQECCVLVDDPQFPNFTDYPTRANMIRYMGWLVADARPGDVLFVHYSGHGGQTRAVNDSQEEYDQTLCPVDYATAGTILDDDLFLLLCQPLPPGVRLTCVFDCCHSASMLDLPFSFVASHQLQQRTGYQMRQVRNDNFANADILLFSGCTDDGTSADIQGGPNGAGGAATNAFTWCLLNTSGLSFMDILLKTRNNLKSQGYKQVPQLTSSKPVDLSKSFSLFGPLSVNQQQMQQQVPPPFQHHPPPQMMHFNLPPPPGPGYHQQQCGPYGDRHRFHKVLQADTPRALQADTPRALQADTPRALQADTPRALQADTPRALQADTPRALQADTPRAPQADTPRALQADTPRALQADTPRALQADTPRALQADTPRALQADTPRALQADTPRAPQADTLAAIRKVRLLDSTHRKEGVCLIKARSKAVISRFFLLIFSFGVLVPIALPHPISYKKTNKQKINKKRTRTMSRPAPTQAPAQGSRPAVSRSRAQPSAAAADSPFIPDHGLSKPRSCGRSDINFRQRRNACGSPAPGPHPSDRRSGASTARRSQLCTLSEADLHRRLGRHTAAASRPSARRPASQSQPQTVRGPPPKTESEPEPTGVSTPLAAAPTKLVPVSRSPTQACGAATPSRRRADSRRAGSLASPAAGSADRESLGDRLQQLKLERESRAAKHDGVWGVGAFSLYLSPGGGVLLEPWDGVWGDGERESPARLPEEQTIGEKKKPKNGGAGGGERAHKAPSLDHHHHHNNNNNNNATTNKSNGRQDNER
eukprot:gene9385-6604_t